MGQVPARLARPRMCLAGVQSARGGNGTATLHGSGQGSVLTVGSGAVVTISTLVITGRTSFGAAATTAAAASPTGAR